jgi:tellurite resistance-related uncharacterized protein
MNVERAISGYHQDDEGEWVAELVCGHDQHVRHRPPFQNRPWVLSDAGRDERMRTPLACPLCDRGELPARVRLTRSSPEWDECTLPLGLRRAHRLPAGTWGRIALRDGRLRLAMATTPPLEVVLAEPGSTRGIPPEVEHDVQPVGPVRFAIDFFEVDRRMPKGGEAADGTPARSDEGGDPACWEGRACPDCGIILDGSSHRLGCSHRDQ